MTTRRLQYRMAVVLGCVLAAGAARAADVESVLARMRQAVEPATTMRATFDFEITNRKGESVHWGGNLYRKAGPPTHMRLAFESPPDMKGAVVDVTRGKDQVTHTRIYLPSVRRVRDVEADARGESFLGTDFNYEDLGFQQVDFQRHTLKEDETMEGTSCLLLESVPDRGWWYGKIRRCLDPKTHLPVRTEYYDRSGVLWKVRSFEGVTEIGGHPTPARIRMETIPTGTSTTITLRDVRYDTDLPDSLFATQ